MQQAVRRTGLVLIGVFGGALARGQSTVRVSVDSAGAQASAGSGGFAVAISADGRFVVFDSLAANLVGSDTNQNADVFVHDCQSGTTARVSVASGGTQANSTSGNSGASVSDDGRFVAFDSAASNLVAGDTNGAWDIFVHDRQNLTTERVSVSSSGLQGGGASQFPSISGDGRFVVFTSVASNLVTGDSNLRDDVFVRDRVLGTTERVSVATSGAQSNGDSQFGSISPDGRFVAFSSGASNLVAGDTNGVSDIFLRDRQLATTERVSVDSTGGQAGAASYFTALSADGRFVVFASHASNLVASDGNGVMDVFLRDRQLATTERVSVDSAGLQGDLSSGSVGVSISTDGRFVAFDSNATNLVPLDTNFGMDTFLRDRLLGTTERVSVDSAGVQGNISSSPRAVSADARFVAFSSSSSNLVAGDTNGGRDVFLRDRALPPLLPFCLGDGSALDCPCVNNGASGKGCENSAGTGGALLSSAGTALLASDTLVLTSSGELPSALSIFLQGDAAQAPAVFGDGLRCAGGTLKRLYARNASGGVVSAPEAGDPSISARSAALGDLLAAGATRHYQTYYRDPVLGFCANPPGNNWNISSGISVLWAQ